MTGMILACTNSTDFVRCHQVAELLNDYKEITADLVGNPQFEEHRQRILQWQIRWETFLAHESISTECGWEGAVEGFTFLRPLHVEWTCPACGTKNTTWVQPEDVGANV